jgi:hypothetical protein
VQLLVPGANTARGKEVANAGISPAKPAPKPREMKNARLFPAGRFHAALE